MISATRATKTGNYGRRPSQQAANYFAGKIDCRHDIVVRLGDDRVGTRLRRPAVDPAESPEVVEFSAS